MHEDLTSVDELTQWVLHSTEQWQQFTFIASVTVLIIMKAKMPYSKPREVTSHQMRYCTRAFGM